MTQKERIIELVKQNIITMDEALQLLEASAKQETGSEQVENELVEEYQQAQSAIEHEIHTEKDTKASSYTTVETLKEVTDQYDKKQEALKIAKQRLRELEIFAELDDLTDEMKAQKANLVEKIAELSSELEELAIEIDVSRQEQRQNVQEQIKKIVDDTAEQVSKVARNFSEEAKKESGNLKNTLKNYVKDFAENFDKKEFNFKKEFNISVPWFKSQTFTHTYHFPATNFKKVSLEILNGSAEIKTHDLPEVIFEVDGTVYGKAEEDIQTLFDSLVKIAVNEEAVIFDAMNARIAADVVVKIPKNSFEELLVNLYNGDIEITDVKVDEMNLKNKNGDIKCASAQITTVNIDSFNGDVALNEMIITELFYKMVNGDFRMKGAAGNVNGDVVNGDIIITKQNQSASNIAVKTLSGDIKVSIPAELSLVADVNIGYGELQHRLSNVEVAGNHIERQIANNELVTLELSTSSGDVYLKD